MTPVSGRVEGRGKGREGRRGGGEGEGRGGKGGDGEREGRGGEGGDGEREGRGEGKGGKVLEADSGQWHYLEKYVRLLLA